MNSNYQDEAKKLYGSTNSYKEYESKNKSKDELNKSSKELMDIFKLFGTIKNEDDEVIFKHVKLLQDFITNNFYTCTDEILLGLSNLYVKDERFKENIDKAGGAGTAEFVSNSIKKYLENK